MGALGEVALEARQEVGVAGVGPEAVGRGGQVAERAEASDGHCVLLMTQPTDDDRHGGLAFQEVPAGHGSVH